MKHYRILEKKGETKQYTIQYSKPLFFGLFYWKTINISEDYNPEIIPDSSKTYNKYDAALTAVKKVIVQEDYETPTVGYHYIDAYKIFKTVKK